MIGIKDHKTRYMFDPFDYLGQKRKKLLDEFWPGTFREHVRPILPNRSASSSSLIHRFCRSQGWAWW
jgi:hypothetical protein